jgi:hypothetical protein
MIAILLMPKDFQARDIYIDYRFDSVKFRWEKDTKKVFRRRDGEDEIEISHTSNLFRDAVSSGKEITRDDYFTDPPAG